MPTRTVLASDLFHVFEYAQSEHDFISRFDDIIAGSLRGFEKETLYVWQACCTQRILTITLKKCSGRVVDRSLGGNSNNATVSWPTHSSGLGHELSESKSH